MPDKRMLIVDAEVARLVDENRGDMERSEFIAFLIEASLPADAIVTARVYEAAGLTTRGALIGEGRCDRQSRRHENHACRE